MLKFQWLEVPQYVPVQKLVKIGTLNLLLLKIKERKKKKKKTTTQCTVKTFKLIFSNGLRHTCNLQKHATSTFIGVETCFKCQNNEQNLQI